MVTLLQTTHGCGDLIFSSHTTFALVGVMSYQEYGTINSIKVRFSLSASFTPLLHHVPVLVVQRFRELAWHHKQRLFGRL